mmetsp:Transcript_27098/g.62461  ORF Transcript_27098/g.62461 Transcript_27098/m.62461 type:complete len:217 (+) Transcript_27098:610-1260(+)
MAASLRSNGLSRILAVAPRVQREEEEEEDASSPEAGHQDVLQHVRARAQWVFGVRQRWSSVRKSIRFEPPVDPGLWLPYCCDHLVLHCQSRRVLNQERKVRAVFHDGGGGEEGRSILLRRCGTQHSGVSLSIGKVQAVVRHRGELPSCLVRGLWGADHVLRRSRVQAGRWTVLQPRYGRHPRIPDDGRPASGRVDQPNIKFLLVWASCRRYHCPPF